MYVCVCKAVTERQVKQAVQEGAASIRDLRHRLGVTGDCGRCAKCALECLRSHAPARAATVHVQAEEGFGLMTAVA